MSAYVFGETGRPRHGGCPRPLGGHRAGDQTDIDVSAGVKERVHQVRVVEHVHSEADNFQSLKVVFSTWSLQHVPNMYVHAHVHVHVSQTWPTIAASKKLPEMHKYVFFYTECIIIEHGKY